MNGEILTSKGGDGNIFNLNSVGDDSGAPFYRSLGANLALFQALILRGLRKRSSNIPQTMVATRAHGRLEFSTTFGKD
jgi:hypothetical protein